MTPESTDQKLTRLHWRADRQRINSLCIPGSSPQYAKPDTELLLRVQNDFFTAGAVFRRKDGVWSVVKFAPILHWLKKTPFDQIKTQLLKRGCSWEWLRDLEPDGATVGPAATAMPGSTNQG